MSKSDKIHLALYIAASVICLTATLMGDLSTFAYSIMSFLILAGLCTVIRWNLIYFSFKYGIRDFDLNYYEQFIWHRTLVAKKWRSAVLETLPNHFPEKIKKQQESLKLIIKLHITTIVMILVFIGLRLYHANYEKHYDNTNLTEELKEHENK